jgi:lipoteichoic acid synthase
LEEPIHVSEPCCNIDILPTVLNLFGLRFDSRLIAGRDVFSNTVHCAALYNKNIITDIMTYNSATGEAQWSGGRNDTDKYRENYQKFYINMLNNRYSMSLMIEDTDFYRFVWDNTVFTEPELEPEPDDGIPAPELFEPEGSEE